MKQFITLCALMAIVAAPAVSLAQIPQEINVSRRTEARCTCAVVPLGNTLALTSITQDSEFDNIVLTFNQQVQQSGGDWGKIPGFVVKVNGVPQSLDTFPAFVNSGENDATVVLNFKRKTVPPYTSLVDIKPTDVVTVAYTADSTIKIRSKVNPSLYFDSFAETTITDGTDRDVTCPVLIPVILNDVEGDGGAVTLSFTERMKSQAYTGSLFSVFKRNGVDVVPGTWDSAITGTNLGILSSAGDWKITDEFDASIGPDSGAIDMNNNPVCYSNGVQKLYKPALQSIDTTKPTIVGASVDFASPTPAPNLTLTQGTIPTFNMIFSEKVTGMLFMSTNSTGTLRYVLFRPEKDSSGKDIPSNVLKGKWVANPAAGLNDKTSQLIFNRMRLSTIVDEAGNKLDFLTNTATSKLLTQKIKVQ